MNRKHSRTEWIQQTFVYTPEPLAELPESDRPDNRILRDGPAVCNTAELLQALIGGPKAESVARALLGRYPNVSAITQAPVAELTAVACGLGEKGAIKLKVALELGRRALTYSSDPRPQIKTPADAAQLLMPEMSVLDQEEVRTLLLDSRNRLLGVPMLYRGSLNQAGMRIGEVFKPAIRYNAAAMIVCHNHPSGDPAPSAEDVRVTKTLVQAGKLLDIEVLDHVILASGGKAFISLKERGLGFDD